MRLSELNPRWVNDVGAPADAKQGVSFLCPCCRTTKLAIFFDVPLCGNPPAALDNSARVDAGHLTDHHVGSILWHREGSDFETLSLTPSIDASSFGHWHGYITAGEIR
jgi:hypothetical protein